MRSYSSWLRSQMANPKKSSKKHQKQPRHKTARIIRPFLERLEERVCPTNYDYNIIAQTESQITSITQFPSINDSGQVAFVGTLATGADAVFVGTGNGTAPVNLPTGTSSAVTYLPTAQINNAGYVLATQISTSPKYFASLDVWKMNNAPGAPTPIAGSGVSGTSILAHAALANDADPTTGNGIAFGALTSPGAPVTLQRSNGELGFGTLLSGDIGSASSFQPMIANNNQVVFRAGNGPNSDIMLNQGPGKNTLIASASDFSALGAAPGISPDGQVVVFYGNLTASGAASINNRPDQGKAGCPQLQAGPGIFASVQTVSHGRVLIRVARTGGNQQGLPDVASFDADNRVVVNSMHKIGVGSAFTVAFMGQSLGSPTLPAPTICNGIFVNLVDVFGSSTDPTGFRPNVDTLVAETGDTITGIDGAIQSLNMDDSINSFGQVAFWMNTTKGVNAVVVANPIPVMAVTPLSQGQWHDDPYAGGGPIPKSNPPKTYTMGNNGCALYNLTMAVDYSGAPSINRFTPPDLDRLLLDNGGYLKNSHSIDWTTGPDKAAKYGGASNLKFHYSVSGQADSPKELTQLLNTYEEPVIAGVDLSLVQIKPGKSMYMPGHFVLVTGKIGDQFTINDPGESSNHYLSAFGNEFQIRGYYTDPTDLSVLGFTVVAPTPVDLLVMNGSQQQTGIDPNTGNIDSNIPQSVTFADALEESVGSTSFAETTTDVIITQPIAGNYTLTVGGATGEPYTLYACPIATDGSMPNQTLFTGTVVPGATSTYTFDYNPQAVPAAPVVVINPESQIATAGNSVSFFASASGDPAPSVQWQVSTDSGNTFADIAGATSNTLTVTPTADQNDYEYRAVFTNARGTATTTPATLTVNAQSGGLVISSTTGVFPQFTFTTPPNVSQDFGAQIVTLPNGNIVATDPLAGAVYLFNGQTGALISTLTGTGQNVQVTGLTNGNFVVLSPYAPGLAGAVTWGSGTTGVSGGVSAANSLIGLTQGQFGPSPYITPLSNGNYVVDNPGWHDGLGAVTWGNGSGGTTGLVSAANSLVGSNAPAGFNPGDQIGLGTGGAGSGVIALANGNYVVASPNWNDYLGAATWCNGSTGTFGTVSASNSLVGSSRSDQIGSGGSHSNCVVALPNGNYVVDSPYWNNGAGAVTWGNGTTGTAGVVSSANSLIGSRSGIAPDNVGLWVIALTNGNYVVDSPEWADEPNGYYGAVTWGNGSTGITGPVSAGDSLTTGTYGDIVGTGGITALTNGNYVVDSPEWGYVATTSLVGFLGAVTWCNGTTGMIGTVSASNSLIGSTVADSVGSGDLYGGEGITPLANGNYVVDSSSWNNSEGAVTWGNGTAGTVGVVSADNSLVGSTPTDKVGNYGVTALTNGNYVVVSPNWYYNQGAVTWGDGTKGITGSISAANSLIGDNLSNDQMGDYGVGQSVIALTNGNYVVLSPDWNNSEGAATWGNGTTGIDGTVSSSNSLIKVAHSSNGGMFVTSLPNGNYFVVVNNGGGDERATWMDGTNGTTLDGKNVSDSQNSMKAGGVWPIGSGDTLAASSVTVDSDGNYQYSVSAGTVDSNQLTYTFGEGQTITVTPDFITRALNAGINVTLQSNDDITINSPIIENPTGTPGNLTLEAGRSIILNGSINTAGGNLTLIANDSLADGVVNSERDPGDAVIAEQSGAAINTGTGALTVDLKNGTDKTNNGVGTVTLPNVNASSETLSSSSTVGITINGNTPGDGVTAGTYTQLDVSGSIDLNDASLAITHSAATPKGTTFIIVQSASGVSGTFSGLSEGATVVADDGTEFTISYQGNGGKEVVLTQITPSPSAPAFTSAVSATFTVGTAASFTVTASGFPVPTLSESSSDTLPSGITFNAATGVLSGTPTAGSSGTYTLNFTAANTVGSVAQTFTLTVNQAPAITSSNSVTFAVGDDGSFTVTATGSPTPTLTETGSLPSGVFFTDNGNGTATLGGMPTAGTSGKYQVTITAHNGVGSDAVQNFTLTVNQAQAPTITSGNSATFIAGLNGSFTVTATGSPSPTLTEYGGLPTGVTFTNNGNGTATLGGTPASSTGGTYQFTITAHNGVGTDYVQNFTLTVTPSQAPTITSGNSVIFTEGQGGSFLVTATGLPTPTLTEYGPLPSGLAFTNNGNGTASLAGTPALGTHGTYQFSITAHNGIGSDFTQSFTLTINPAFLPPPPPPPPPQPPTLKVPPLLAFFDSLLGGIETINDNGTETIVDRLFGFPLLVANFDSAGNLMSVNLLGFNVTFLFA